MSFFDRLFRKIKPQISCPRCLGKGQVDWEDIKRLNQELKWRPGPCAYCAGSGEVDSEIESKVSVDEPYLTSELSAEERQKLIDNESEAVKKAQLYDAQMENLIKQIAYLHFTGKLNSETIADFYLLPMLETAHQHEAYLEEKEELVNYINKVIEKKK
ncbi:MAG: hypothetical protein IAF38_03640 [Bacteroidia bacterium]|nr:hypothetical protein [Bacteroidia bacterium]